MYSQYSQYSVIHELQHERDEHMNASVIRVTIHVILQNEYFYFQYFKYVLILLLLFYTEVLVLLLE